MQVEKKFEDQPAQIVTNLKQDGRKIQVLEHVVNGKVELDQDSLQYLAAQFPDSKVSFVAGNAPFDPVRHI